MDRDLVIEHAQIDDAVEILALQKLAYQSEAAIWNDYTIPPLTQTLEEIRTEFNDHCVLKVVSDGRIIGSVRAYQKQGTCCIGKLIVHPNFQNQGIGTKIMHAIEQEFSDVERFELFTGTKSERNLYLYHKLGYRPFKEVRLSEKVDLVYLEKLNNSREG